MTPAELAAARALGEAAAPPPWKSSETMADEAVVYVDDPDVAHAAIVLFQADWGTEADAAFIAAARTGWPAALDRVEELERRLAGALPSVHSYEDYASMSNNLARIEKERAEAAEAEVERLRAQLRAVERYADGLHFAGRLSDEKIVRAALESMR